MNPSYRAVAMATDTRRRMRYAEWHDWEGAKGIKKPSQIAMVFLFIFVYRVEIKFSEGAVYCLFPPFAVQAILTSPHFCNAAAPKAVAKVASFGISKGIPCRAVTPSKTSFA